MLVLNHDQVGVFAFAVGVGHVRSDDRNLSSGDAAVVQGGSDMLHGFDELLPHVQQPGAILLRFCCVHKVVSAFVVGVLICFLFAVRSKAIKASRRAGQPLARIGLLRSEIGCSLRGCLHEPYTAPFLLFAGPGSQRVMRFERQTPSLRQHPRCCKFEAKCNETKAALASGSEESRAGRPGQTIRSGGPSPRAGRPVTALRGALPPSNRRMFPEGMTVGRRLHRIDRETNRPD